MYYWIVLFYIVLLPINANGSMTMRDLPAGEPFSSRPSCLQTLMSLNRYAQEQIACHHRQATLRKVACETLRRGDHNFFLGNFTEAFRLYELVFDVKYPCGHFILTDNERRRLYNTPLNLEYFKHYTRLINLLKKAGIEPNISYIERLLNIKTIEPEDVIAIALLDSRFFHPL